MDGNHATLLHTGYALLAYGGAYAAACIGAFYEYILHCDTPMPCTLHVERLEARVDDPWKRLTLVGEPQAYNSDDHDMAVALLSEHQSVAFQHQDMDQEALRGARRALTFAYDLSTFIPSLLHMLKERRMFPSLSELACDAGRDCYRLEEPSAWQQELRDADLVGAIARETLSTLSSPFTYWLPSKAAQHADSPTRQTARIARLERVRLARESGIAHRITELITLPEVTDLLAVYHQSHHPGVQDALAGMLELRAWQLPTDEQCCWPTAAYGF